MKKKLLFALALTGLSLTGYSQWTSQDSISTHNGQEGAVAHPNGNIYLIGGYNGSAALDSLWIFNQAGNTWSKGAPVPTVTRGMAYALGADSMIYIFGGFNSGYDDSCYKYNTKTNTWTSIAAMPTAEWFAAAATAPNGKIYVFGGEPTQSLVQIYDPTLNSWSSGTAIPTPVQEEGAMTGPDGKIYVIGGLNSGGVAIDSVQVYNPMTNTWGRGNPMPTSRNEFAYVVDDVNHLLYCIGGKAVDGNNVAPFYGVVEYYNVADNLWLTGTPLPHGLGETAGASINNGINVFCGADTATVYSVHNYRMHVAPNGIPVISAQDAFEIYPNPSSGIVNMEISTVDAKQITIHIMDITGQVIYTTTWSGQSGYQVKNIDMSGFSKGMYFIQYTSGSSNVIKKLILQ